MVVVEGVTLGPKGFNPQPFKTCLLFMNLNVKVVDGG